MSERDLDHELDLAMVRLAQATRALINDPLNLLLENEPKLMQVQTDKMSAVQKAIEHWDKIKIEWVDSKRHKWARA